MRWWSYSNVFIGFFFAVFFSIGAFFYNLSALNLTISIFIVLFSFLVGYSKSIVLSVLSLIALAGTFSLTLFGFGASFLAVLYLAVYIGAVAVFFLFVVMMTDLSDEELLKTKNLQKPGILATLICFFLATLVTFLVINLNFFKNFKSLLLWDYVDSSRNSTSVWGFLNFDSNIELIARALFNQNVAAFIILSIVILVALVGAILLTSSINLVDKSELFFLELDPLNAVWEEERLNTFGDGRPQNMDDQLARTTSASVNLNKAKYF